MASIKDISLPHGTIPTQMFGNVNLQNAIMYVNENFAEVKSGVNDAVAAANDALDAKADADHDHDEDYAAISHTHTQSEITGLSSALDGKADLNHSHSQYLSSLPAHYHATSEVQGLDERLQAKAESVHTHEISDVDNLTTELGAKASTAYVDQQVSSVSSSIKTVADNEIESYASDNKDVADTPKDVEVKPVNETDEQKKARIGSSTEFARKDHKHVIETETDATKLSSLKPDGDGTDGAASFGTSAKVPRLDHSHPLNFPEGKPVTAMSPDGIGKGGTALFGGTDYYADLGHSHPLNVATSGSPSDVVKSTGTASLGSAETYARTDHVHKMPSLAATDISYDGSTVAAKLDNHESRIKTLEEAPAPTFPVTSVNGQTGDVELDADDVGALDSDDIGDSVQAYSAKLTSLDGALDSNGKVPLSQLTGNIDGHTGNCYVTIDNDGKLGHSGNAAYNLLNNAANDASGERGAHKIITDLDVGNGIEADSSTHNIKVKAKTNGGITVDADGISLGGLSGTGFVKSENGSLSVPQKQPIVTPDGSGALYSNGTAVSTKSIGNGSSYDIASGSHTHAYGDGTLTGFGTAAEKSADSFAVKATETTAANALSAAGEAKDAADAAQKTADAKLDKSTADGYYQPKSSVLTAVSGGGYYGASNGGAHEVTSGAHYISSSAKARLLGVAANATSVSAREAIGTDMVTYDGTNTLDGIVGNDGKISASDVVIDGASGGKVVETDSNGSIVETSSTYAKFSSAPVGGRLLKSDNANGGVSEMSLAASKWMKTDASGLPATTDESPVTVPSSTGVLYGNGTVVSTKSIGAQSGMVAAGDHTHAYGSASLTGFGTAAECSADDFASKATESVASTASQNASTAIQNAAAAQKTADGKIDKSTADGYYQAKSDVLAAIAGSGYYGAGNKGAHDITSGAHYIAAASAKARILGIAANSTSVGVRDAIGTDMVSYDGTNTLDDVIDSSGNVDASYVSFSSASGSKVVETDASGALVESSSDYAKFSSTPAGSKWVKTSGTDGTLAEVAEEDEPLAPPESSATNDRVATCKANGTAVTWENALSHTMDANPVNDEIYPSDAEDDYPSDFSFTEWQAGNAAGKGLTLSAYVMLSEYDGSRLMLPIVISITKDGLVSSVKKSASAKCLTVNF